MANPFPRIAGMARQRLIAAAALLQGEHKRDLSKTFPPASKPGQFPTARTLNLRDSVGVQEVEGGFRVGYLPGAYYLVFLAKRGRLTVLDTAKRIAPRLARIITGRRG